MRREGTYGNGRSAIRLALAAAMAICSAKAVGGLRFVPDVGYPLGGDLRSLAAANGVFWAGTASGVFRGTSISGGWSFDGLAGKPVSSIALLNGEAFAATGEELWRRSADGTWTRETLPSANAFPTTVAVDAGGTLWVGGLGAWRRTGANWTAARVCARGLACRRATRCVWWRCSLSTPTTRWPWGGVSRCAAAIPR